MRNSCTGSRRSAPFRGIVLGRTSTSRDEVAHMCQHHSLNSNNSSHLGCSILFHRNLPKPVQRRKPAQASFLSVQCILKALHTPQSARAPASSAPPFPDAPAC